MHMKIALLNLPMDNNYGGNLQRYALMKILQNMGHDVTHISLLFNKKNLPFYMYPTTIAKYLIKILIGRNPGIFKCQLYSRDLYDKQLSIIMPFYDKYIKHTKKIYDISELKFHVDFDVFIVGSDQVWRKNIAHEYLSAMFLDYLDTSTNSKRIAYSISLGTDENELSSDEINNLTPLYKQFSNVSVREDSALELLKLYGWTLPMAEHTLDPTLLLRKEDYLSLIERGNTVASTGDMFCYILDISETKRKTIDKIANMKGLCPFYISLDNLKSIEQWLRSFVDAKFVITDSYHGFLFSIIFNKSFYLFNNTTRGNSRFESVCRMLNIEINKEIYDWPEINERLKYWQFKSMAFLTSSLK